ncbi:hypothetical protein [Natronococcus roseus]|uniref:hypothetical protein n=1 Tax=Natronococcus roseus TaxID=1052014 RepID=UPI00374D3DEA
MVDPADTIGSVEETATTLENVEARVIDTDIATAHVPEWPALPVEAKMALMASAEVPTTVIRDRNTTTDGYHALLVDLLDASADADLTDDVYLDVGEGAEDGTDPSNEEVNDEVTSVEATAFNGYPSEGELRVLSFISPNVANGHVLDEVGLRYGDRMVNHSTLTREIEKDENTEATITVVLSFGHA